MAVATRSRRPKRKRRSSLGLGEELSPSPMPTAPLPMLFTLLAEPFDDPDWIFEPKLDGLRVIVRFDGNDVLVLSRNLASQNFQFPEIVAACEESLTRPMIVDGEVVCFDERGRSSFRALQQRFHLKNAREVEARMRKHPAYLFLFDLLYVDRFDVTTLPLRRRKELLEQTVRWSSQVRNVVGIRGEGRRTLKQACAAGEEGIVGKHLESLYVPARSPWWVKLKCIGRQEFVIGGFTEPQRSRVGLGSLLVGYYSDDGKRLIYAGKVGTGFTNEGLLDLRKRLGALEQSENPFDAEEGPRMGVVHWVKPMLVAEIAYAEWTQNTLLRQPRFEGLRPDKKPRDCRRERPLD